MLDVRTCVIESLEARTLMAAGALDPSFGQGGRLAVQFPGSEVITVVRDRALQSDGKIVISGDAPDPAAGAGGTDFAVGRLNPDGTPDTTFGGGDGVVVFHDPGNGDSATGVAVQPDGKIVASGTFTNNNDQGVPDYSIFAALRFNPDGTADANWGADGVAVTQLGDPGVLPFDAAGDVVIDPSGRVIVIGGRTNGTTGATEIALVGYDPADGSLDPAFGDGGKVFARVRRESETGAAGVLQPDGKLLVTGAAFDLPDADARSIVTTFLTARFNPDGTLDTGFGDGGAAYTDFSGRSGAPVQFALSDAIALQADGKILVGGLVARGGSSGRVRFPVALARLNPDGSPDLAFGKLGKVESNLGQLTSVNQILVQDDGRILCSGLAAPTLAQVTAGRFSALVVQYDAAGNLDKTFGTGGRVIIPPPSAAAASATGPTSARPQQPAPSNPLALASASARRAPGAAEVLAAAAPQGGTPNVGDALSQQATVVVALNDRLLVVSSSGDQLNAAQLIGNGPDVAVAPPAARRRAVAGGKGAAVVRVSNDGNAPVPAATAVTLVLSQDQVLDAGDRAVGAGALGADLAPRRRKVLRLRFDYPLDLPAGAWFVLAVADPGPADVVASNNAAASRAPVNVSGAA
jgi:uncharacterized delta-60 repeat protein